MLGIEEPATGILVAGIIALAHALGMRVVAEGVGTDAALQCLRNLGCDAVQGYLTGRPGPNGGSTCWSTAPNQNPPAMQVRRI